MPIETNLRKLKTTWTCDYCGKEIPPNKDVDFILLNKYNVPFWSSKGFYLDFFKNGILCHKECYDKRLISQYEKKNTQIS